MNARDDILAGLRAAESGSVGDETPEQLLDAYRAEVLAEAARVVHVTTAPADWDADAVALWNAGTNIAADRLRRMAAEAGESRG